MQTIRVKRAAGDGYDELAALDDSGHVRFVEGDRGVTVTDGACHQFVPWAMVRSLSTPCAEPAALPESPSSGQVASMSPGAIHAGRKGRAK